MSQETGMKQIWEKLYNKKHRLDDIDSDDKHKVDEYKRRLKILKSEIQKAIKGMKRITYYITGIEGKEILRW